ncbi:MAG: acyltransferase [Dokdonella sp.]
MQDDALRHGLPASRDSATFSLLIDDWWKMSSVSNLLRALLASVLIALNIAVHVTPLLLLALLKLVVPITDFRRAASCWLVAIAESWISVNSALFRLLGRTTIHVELPQGLRHDGRYLVFANHQSWVDIPVLQSVFNQRIPFLRFFLKEQLIWVPVMGLAWWALDFPFMKRTSKAQLARRPDLRGSDVAATRRACEKFRDIPVSVMNFVEGTRFTSAKHDRQRSPFRHLLKPRAGGIALVLESMGAMLDAAIDVSIVYPQGRPTMADLVCGRIRDVRVDVHVVAIPADLIGGDYENDPAFRKRVQAWVNQRWTAKDAAIDALVRDD